MGVSVLLEEYFEEEKATRSTTVISEGALYKGCDGLTTKPQCTGCLQEKLGSYPETNMVSKRREWYLVITTICVLDISFVRINIPFKPI